VVVTVIFTPPGNAPRNAVVDARDCSAFASRKSACESALGPGGVASCVVANDADLAATASDTEGEVRFRFPDTDSLAPMPGSLAEFFVSSTG